MAILVLSHKKRNSCTEKKYERERERSHRQSPMGKSKNKKINQQQNKK